MINLLLEKIKNLENELEKVKKNNLEAKNEILTLFKKCKIDKTIKENFKKNFLKAINKLEVNYNDKFFNEFGLRYTAFVEIIKNSDRGFLVIVNANYSEEIKRFILGFLTKKISPFFTLDENMIIGFLDKDEYKTIKNITTIPYFNPHTNEFNEINLKKMIFESDRFDFEVIEKAKKIFKEFLKRPSYKNKNYIEFSLIKNKIVDFERETLDKQKGKFSFVFEESYPNLEIKLKQELKNTPFILAVLEKIDQDMEKIKTSKGLSNIINRMLNFIELNVPEVREDVRFLRERLRK